MTVRQIAYRLKSEGKAEVIRDANEVGSAIRASYAQAEAGANAASTAADRQEQRYKRLAAAAREAGQAEAAQARYNMALGVSQGSGGSARDSAAFFAMQAEAMEDGERRARALRSVLDPLGAAQDRLNDELAEYNRLAAAGQINTTELAQAQRLARQRFDESTAAIDRQGRGMSRLVIASRLNLARQGADVAVTAAMGMNPAMIAIQQGPQILDALSTSGLKARGSMLLLGGALTAAAAGAAVAVAAWNDAEGQALKLDRAVSGLGRTAGLNAREVEAFAQASAEASGISIRAARDIAATYVSTGRISGAVLGDLIELTKDYASFTGQDAAGAADALAKAMMSPDKAARDMTRSFGLMDQATLDTIDSLMKQGDQLAAQKLLIEALDGAVSGHGDRVGDLASLWDAAARAVSNYWDKLGRALYTTPDEKLANLDRALVGARNREASGIRLRPGFIEGLEAQRAELLRAQLDDQRRAASAPAARRNQEAQLAVDRRERTPRRRSDRSAEREARERQARERRAEDRATEIELEVARSRGDADHIRVLEDEIELRKRIRQLVDDDVDEATARTTALREQAQLMEAREVATDREFATLQRTHGIELERLLGNERFASVLERHADLAQRIKGYQDARLDTDRATAIANRDLLEIEQARADVMARMVADADRGHRLNLARLAGRSEEFLRLDRQARIDARAREIEDRSRAGSRPLNRGEGLGQATREIGEEVRAEAEGVRREWIRGFVDDVRRSGLSAAIGEQLEKATDRMLDRMIDRLMDVDWTQIFKGQGQGGGGWGNILSTIGAALFGGEKAGQNASGTEFWRGGLTWVGEAGKELVDLPRGARIRDHSRSMQMAAAQSAVTSAARFSLVIAPVLNAQGAGPREVETLSRRMDEMVDDMKQQVPALVRDALSRRIIR